jgi:hypothetical protein
MYLNTDLQHQYTDTSKLTSDISRFKRSKSPFLCVLEMYATALGEMDFLAEPMSEEHFVDLQRGSGSPEMTTASTELLSSSLFYVS